MDSSKRLLPFLEEFAGTVVIIKKTDRKIGACACTDAYPLL
jgi:hypothetical protein